MDLFGFFFRRLLFSKRTLFFALFPLALTAIVFVPRDDQGAVDFFRQIYAFVYLGSMGVFLPMYFGTRAFGEEIENGTIVYPLTRPRKRGEYLIAKYLAAACASALLLAPFPALGSWALAKQEESAYWSIDVGFLCLLLVIAAFVYTAFFLAIGVALKRPVVFGVIVTFVWENFISYLPGRFKEFTVMHFLRSMLIRGYEVDRFVNIPVPAELPSLGASIAVFLSVTAVSLALAWFFLRKKEFI